MIPHCHPLVLDSGLWGVQECATYSLQEVRQGTVTKKGEFEPTGKAKEKQRGGGSESSPLEER